MPRYPWQRSEEYGTPLLVEAHLRKLPYRHQPGTQIVACLPLTTAWNVDHDRQLLRGLPKVYYSIISE